MNNYYKKLQNLIELFQEIMLMMIIGFLILFFIFIIPFGIKAHLHPESVARAIYIDNVVYGPLQMTEGAEIKDSIFYIDGRCKNAIVIFGNNNTITNVSVLGAASDYAFLITEGTEHLFFGAGEIIIDQPIQLSSGSMILGVGIKQTKIKMVEED